MHRYLIKNTAVLHKILRILITKNCNYNCIYCHNEGMDNNTNDLLNISDYSFLINTMKSIFERVAIAGGEPLLSNNLIDIAKLSVSILGERVHLTTNASLLMDNVIENINLFERINISINSLNKETFYNITKANLSSEILNNVKRLCSLDTQIQINTVLLNNINVSEVEVKLLLDFSKRHDIKIEFLHFQNNNFIETVSAIKTFYKIVNRLGYSSKLLIKPFCHPTTLFFCNNHSFSLREYVQLINSFACKNCTMRLYCMEGISHIRLLPNGILKACRYGVNMQEDILQSIKYHKVHNIKEAIRRLQNHYNRQLYWQKLL
jgi:cyclic pyranopterin phosphate synthase